MSALNKRRKPFQPNGLADVQGGCDIPTVAAQHYEGVFNVDDGIDKGSSVSGAQLAFNEDYRQSLLANFRFARISVTVLYLRGAA